MKKVVYLCNVCNVILVLALASLIVSCDSYFKPSEDKGDESDLTGSYSVRHYQQNSEDNKYTLFETDPSILCRVGELTKATAKDYEGFVPQNIEQKTVVEDGMTIVDVYYDRKSCEITIDAKGYEESDGKRTEGGGVLYDENGAEVESLTIKGKYGANIESLVGLAKNKENGTFVVSMPRANPPVTMSYPGYVFQRFEPATIPAEPCTVSAVWRDERIQYYKVYHHFQDFTGTGYDNDSKDFPEIQSVAGLKGYKTEAKVNSYEGFFCVGTQAKLTEHKMEMEGARVTVIPDSQQKTIGEDDSTELHLYYNRTIVHVTLDANEVTDSATMAVTQGVFADGGRRKVVAGRYGATIPTDTFLETMGFDLPTCEGYTFSHWNPKAYPSNDGEVEAIWLDNNSILYSVFHHFQNINDDGYDKDRAAEEFKFPGKFGAATQAAANSYTGFTCIGTDRGTETAEISQEVIEETGAEVHIYYKRAVIQVTLDASEATDNATGVVAPGAFADGGRRKVVAGRYGAAIPTDTLLETMGFDLPTCEGYTFSHWEPKEFPAADGEVKAIWFSTPSCSYSVFHHFQNVSGEEYDNDRKAEKRTLNGKRGLLTQAEKNDYTGFRCIGTDKDTDADTIVQKTIEETGAEVHIYYKRNSYDITFNLGDSGSSAAYMTVRSTNTSKKQFMGAFAITERTITDRYGATLFIEATQTVDGITRGNPYSEGYSVSWDGASPVGATIQESKTYTASWAENDAPIEIHPPSDLGSVKISKTDNGGSIVVFTAEVSDFTPKAVTWFINGKPLSEYSGGTKVSGDLETTLTCTLSSSAFAAGLYSVLVSVTDSKGNVYSAMDSFTVKK